MRVYIIYVCMYVCISFLPLPCKASQVLRHQQREHQALESLPLAMVLRAIVPGGTLRWVRVEFAVRVKVKVRVQVRITVRVKYEFSMNSCVGCCSN